MLVALLVCLIPTTIGALLSAIGIAGMDRLVQRNVLAMSGRAVEAAGDVTTLLLDKTGTITYGNRQAIDVRRRARASTSDGAGRAPPRCPRSPTRRPRASRSSSSPRPRLRPRRAGGRRVVPFTAQTRMCGLDLRRRRRRSARAPARRSSPGSRRHGAVAPTAARSSTSATERDRRNAAARPLVVADATTAGGSRQRVLGVVHLKDVVKDGLASGSPSCAPWASAPSWSPATTRSPPQAIAAEAGVDDFLAEATPEDKLALIRREQEGGNLVAMTGDGTNDAPALAQADVGVAMNTGTSAAKEAGNMVDLDSDPTKLIDIVRIGKQLLITRGALTTFSIANDVAKYFAIIPAMFAGVFPGLARAQHHAAALAGVGDPVARSSSTRSSSSRSIPLALRGVQYRPAGASAHPEPQPAGLRPRRRHRAVHRHQAHRPRRQPHPRLLALDRRTSMSTARTTRPPATWVAVRAMLVLTVVLGVGYTAAHHRRSASSRCPAQANGSLVTRRRRRSVGSALIGQSFTDADGQPLPQWFQSRPSAAGDGYDGAASSGSNYGPENTDLIAAIAERKAAIAAFDGVTRRASPPTP